MVALGRDEHGQSLSTVHEARYDWQGVWAKLLLGMFQEGRKDYHQVHSECQDGKLSEGLNEI